MNRDMLLQEIHEMMGEMIRMPKACQPPAPARGEEACIMVLEAHGGQATPGELAREAAVSSARIAATLRQLESKGYITRDVNKKDRRQVLVSLTEEGREYSRRLLEDMLDKSRQLFDILGDEDSEHFLRILRKIVDRTRKDWEAAAAAGTAEAADENHHPLRKD